MTTFQAEARNFAAQLRAETLALSTIAMLGLIALPFAARTGAVAVLLAVSAALALAALTLSALLAFDAVLFRFMAAHQDEETAGQAVDKFLADARLKPLPEHTRPLTERAAGARRYVRLRRALLACAAICAALSLVLRAAP